MLGLIVSAVLAAGSPELATTPSPAAQHIKMLRPKMSATHAEKLGRLIDYWAGYYRVDPHLMVAIIEHESDFRPGSRACWAVKRKGKQTITCDHGLAQINDVWISKWKLDETLLVDDDGYNIAVQARILAWIKRYYGFETDWYGRYHSGKPSKKAAYVAKLEPLIAVAG